MNKTICTIMALPLILINVAQGSQVQEIHSPRSVVPFDSDWAFQYFPESSVPEFAAAVKYDDSSWAPVATPHTWSTFETTGDIHPFIMEASERRDPYWWRGWGVYRKQFFVGEEWGQKRIFIEFDGVQKYSRVYLNGHFLGEHKGGYTGFSYDLTQFLHLDGTTPNVVVVVVSNRRDDLVGGIPPMTAGNFNVYGGIYRHVRIVATDEIYYPFEGSAQHQGGIFWQTPMVNERRATVRIDGWLMNVRSEPASVEVTTEILDPQGAVVATVSTPVSLAPSQITQYQVQNISIPQPLLWSPETPNVYGIRSTVIEAGVVRDQHRAPLGLDGTAGITLPIPSIGMETRLSSMAPIAIRSIHG
ncbi:MAG: hypothetical protein LR015_07815 [Verrucomicrobia bacterium]|nr:hypothetical protein [Verrucomicrobiota bacterium]